MKNIEELLLNGYTIYISSQDDKVLGMGLRYIEKEGMTPVELNEQDMKTFTKEFSNISKQLKEGYLLQINKPYTYIANLGKTETEEPYGEKQVLNVIEESSAGTLLEVLAGLEEKATNLNQEKIFKKMYRTYGSDKYK